MEKSPHIPIKQLDEEKLLQKLEQSLKHLRIADVELFITAGHAKNLGKSAAFHHLSQSAASVAIHRVETAFGTRLSTHEKRFFRLTREGELLLPRLEQWVKQLKELIIFKEDTLLRFASTHALAQIAVPALFPSHHIEFSHKRPDQAYTAILQEEIDMALVLDNAPWRSVVTKEIGSGHFQLYAKEQKAIVQPVLLPEDQIEVFSFQQNWQKLHGYPLPIKARIPSWSLIATICQESSEVGFLPEFLAAKFGLTPVLFQPPPCVYRILAIYRNKNHFLQKRFDRIIESLYTVFSKSS